MNRSWPPPDSPPSFEEIWEKMERSIPGGIDAKTFQEVIKAFCKICYETLLELR